MCKKISQLLPATVAWSLIVVCSACFYYFLVPAFGSKFGTVARVFSWDYGNLNCPGCVGWAICAADLALFFMVVSNLMMAMCMDPGAHPIGRF